MHRLDLNYATRPKDPSAQAPSPTCPFIIINNVKEQSRQKTADNPPSPIQKPGEGVRSCLATNSATAFQQHPVGEPPPKPTLRFGQWGNLPHLRFARKPATIPR